MRGANETITVWNRYRDTDSRRDVWVSHVVHGCAWQTSASRRTTGALAGADDRVVVLIAAEEGCQVDFDYKSPHVWRDLSSDDKIAYFTVREGDVIARGDLVSSEQLAVSNGHLNVNGEEMTVNDLRELLARDMCVVTRVADNTSHERRGRHLNVNGR
ncbi:MAG: hypothetical protein FWE06_07935 [Oscillospiraceae bacterium]|nr:hypothetical protein [Oscillospiraceae bacterium]